MSAQLKVFKPRKELQKYFHSFWIATCDKADFHRKMPDIHFGILFNLASPSKTHSSWGYTPPKERGMSLGMLEKPIEVSIAGPMYVLGVTINPGTGCPVVGIPMDILSNRGVGVRELWGRENEFLCEELAELPSQQEQVLRLEGILMGRLQRAKLTTDPLVDAVIQKIHKAYGNISVQELETYSGISRQNLAKKFQKYVGVAPKMYCRIGRFHYLLRHIRSSKCVDWSDCSTKFGYFDQSHLIAEFKEFSGLCPEEFLVEGRKYFRQTENPNL